MVAPDPLAGWFPAGTDLDPFRTLSPFHWRFRVSLSWDSHPSESPRTSGRSWAKVSFQNPTCICLLHCWSLLRTQIKTTRYPQNKAWQSSLNCMVGGSHCSIKPRSFDGFADKSVSLTTQAMSHLGPCERLKATSTCVSRILFFSHLRRFQCAKADGFPMVKVSQLCHWPLSWQRGQRWPAGTQNESGREDPHPSLLRQVLG